LSAEKKQQVIALGRLGWSLRRIQSTTKIRRETAASYLNAAGIPVRRPGEWGHQEPKPAIEVSTDPGAEKRLPVRRADGAPRAATSWRPPASCRPGCKPGRPPWAEARGPRFSVQFPAISGFYWELFDYRRRTLFVRRFTTGTPGLKSTHTGWLAGESEGHLHRDVRTEQTRDRRLESTCTRHAFFRPLPYIDIEPRLGNLWVMVRSNSIGLQGAQAAGSEHQSVAILSSRSQFLPEISRCHPRV
jgi:hypothetical protein